MLRYKINPVDALKNAGYSSYRIGKESTFNQTALQAMRDGKMISWANFNRLCMILKMQPGDILEYVPDDEP